MAPPALFSPADGAPSLYTPALSEVLTRLDSLINWERHARARGSQRLMRVDTKPCQLLLEALGNPQNSIKSVIHVTGSKGKGSVSAMITAGLRRLYPQAVVMTYGSPHVERVNERIKINERPIDDNDLAYCLNESLNKQEQLKKVSSPTWFDVMTATGLLSAKKLNVNYAVIEVGMGGRLDSSNIFDGAPVTLITNIQLEHANIIGPTIRDIAHEKAGIIGPNTKTALVGMHRDDSLAEFFTKQAKLFNPPPDVCFIPPSPVDTLFDTNFRLAKAALKALLVQSDERNIVQDDEILSEKTARTAIRSLHARQEHFTVFDTKSQKRVNVLLDGAHVPDSVNTVIREAELENNKLSDGKKLKLFVVIAFGRDKDASGIVNVILKNKHVVGVIATAIGIEAPYLPAEDLKGTIDKELMQNSDARNRIQCDLEKDPKQAVLNAISNAAKVDCDVHNAQAIIIGSFHLAGKVRPLLSKLDSSVIIE